MIYTNGFYTRIPSNNSFVFTIFVDSNIESAEVSLIEVSDRLSIGGSDISLNVFAKSVVRFVCF